jgi:hypothetical protein
MEYAELIRRSNDPNDFAVPPQGLWTGREEKIVRAFFERTLPRPKSLSGVESCAVFIDLSTGYKRYNPLLKPETWELFAEIRREAIPLLIKEIENLKLYEWKEICLALELHDPTKPVETYLASVKSGLKNYLDYIEIDCSSIAIDIRPKGINKGSGLDILVEETGIPLEEILGSGDSSSDILMLERVQYAICPSNSSSDVIECIKKKGEYGFVSTLPYIAGVNDGLKHFLEIQ